MGTCNESMISVGTMLHGYICGYSVPWTCGYNESMDICGAMMDICGYNVLHSKNDSMYFIPKVCSV